MSNTKWKLLARIYWSHFMYWFMVDFATYF